MPAMFADDELTPEQIEQMRKETDLPPADDPKDDAPPAPRADELEDDEAPAPKAAPTAQAPNKSDTDTDEEADGDFKSFADKHKDKSPQELLRLLHQQNNARVEERTARRDAQQRLEALTERIVRTREAARAKAEEERKRFDEELRADPDAATKKLHDRLINEEQEAAERAAWQEFISEQKRLTAEHIPDWNVDTQRDLLRTAVEEFGYAPEEVARASDYRDIVTLDMATRFVRLMKSGVIDRRGNVIGAPMPTGGPAPTRADQSRQTLASAARVAQQAPRTLSDARGTSPVNSAKTLARQAEDLLALSDDEFAKLDPRELNNLLKELG